MTLYHAVLNCVALRGRLGWLYVAGEMGPP